MATLRIPTTHAQPNSDGKPREVTIEAVRRREATVGDFIACRFETRPETPKSTAGWARKIRRLVGRMLRSCRGRQSITPQALQEAAWQRWTENRFGDGSEQQRLTVTYYYPWGYFHPVRSGAAAVASHHLDYFRRRGHRVRMMVRGISHQGRAEFERHYRWVDDLVVVDVGRHPDIQRCFDVWDFGSYLAAHVRLARQPEIRQWLSQPADVAFVNYVFATPLLDSLPADAYRVLETYDIMSHQFLAHSGPTALVEPLLASEFDLYRLYDSVLMISPEEEEVAREHGAANLAYMPPAVDVPPEGSEPAGSEDYDLLFVGSDHPPNVEGLNWFYTHVYLPLLKPKGVRWAICGSACRQLPFTDAGVIRLGLVPDLGGVYRRSKVVVVPLFRGSGISIKTIEAMANRKPVVTTPCGRRGLPDSTDSALITHPFQEDPAAVADTICRLCSSESLREEYGRRAVACISAHFGRDSHDRRMDRIFARVGRRQGAAPPLIAFDRAESALPALGGLRTEFVH
ncbi:MAG TPA: glycosyltransferase family 4 protein [Pirellulales bacterium]|nr:glycosyltransferase family 4 protein [Pirellulales bacterium]